MTTILPFRCPHCGCENGTRFLYPKSSEDSAYCEDCGYNHYYRYRKGNGAYLKIDETKELNYGNIQYVERKIDIPYAVYEFEYRNGLKTLNNLNSLEAYQKFESFQKEQFEGVQKVTVNRFYENKLHKTILYENSNPVGVIEEKELLMWREIWGSKDGCDDLPF
jgi:hypothetical protein